jgi:hypothetical protein
VTLATLADPVKPRCYDCLTEDVAVKVIDTCGFEHWFCAADWASQQEFHERVMALLAHAPERLADP